ncbi:MAG: UDP-3-O-(3-hydroxymyristoyl)glucosamine N-acyltransferase [Flavobacteriales bacterium]
MEFTAQQIADYLGGTVVGDPNAKVNNVSKIEEGKPQTLSFLANPKYTEFIYTTGASVVIVNNDFSPEQALPDTCTLVKVNDAYGSFARLLQLYDSLRQTKEGRETPSFLSPSAEIGDGHYLGAFAYVGHNVKIGKNVKIYPHAYIGDNVNIGDNTIIHSGVKIYHDCIIGANCVIHSGTIIGADGFGFAPNSENNYSKVPQIGNVIVEDYVDIGANSCIDRATLGSTIIKKGAKIDNLIQIAHNVEIGENTVIAAQTGIAGSTKLGANCMLGGQVGVIGHLKLANGTKIAAQSGIQRDTKENDIVQGSPAFDVGSYQKSYVLFRGLPKLDKKISDLEKKIKELEQNNKNS